MPFADLPHARIHYSLSGDNSLPALVLSTSLGTNFSIWDAQVPEFEKHFRLLRYDMRGHGRSSVPPPPYSVPDLASDLLSLVDSLGIDRFHLCGLSVGGQVGNGIGWRRNRGLAVTTHVVSKQAKMLFKFRHLGIPDGEIGAERSRQNESGKRIISRERVMDASVRQIGERHDLSFTRRFLRNLLTGSGQNSIDECSGRAEIIGRFEETRDVFRLQDCSYVDVLGEHHAQMAFFGLRTATCGFNESVGRSAIEFFAESE